MRVWEVVSDGNSCSTLYVDMWELGGGRISKSDVVVVVCRSEHDR